VNLPPLVEPADALSVQEVRRYSRHLIIPDVAMDGQKRLKTPGCCASAPVGWAPQP
jgi:adenylyltransferase/sulfurtransferase